MKIRRSTFPRACGSDEPGFSFSVKHVEVLEVSGAREPIFWILFGLRRTENEIRNCEIAQERSLSVNARTP